MVIQDKSCCIEVMCTKYNNSITNKQISIEVFWNQFLYFLDSFFLSSSNSAHKSLKTTVSASSCK